MHTVTRTYESFDIAWDRGSLWTNYESAAEAQAVIDGSDAGGHVVRRTWEQTWPICSPLLVIARPGIAERVNLDPNFRGVPIADVKDYDGPDIYIGEEG